MGFKSFEFLIFFPAVILLYFSLPYRWRWLMLLLASYVFYMFWRVEYIFLILTSTVIDYVAAWQMGKKETKEARKPWLYLSLFLNLGLLFVFKYFNFFNTNLKSLADLLGWTFEPFDLNLVLPVGISFYTFQTLSYTIDVYRGKYKPERSFLKFALFVAYFPQLVAGPVERADNIIKQFYRNYDFDGERVASGMKLMVWGFFKKVVVADRLAVYVDKIYNSPQMYHDFSFWVATYFFCFQLYCDFSGYTDIARGAARIMGIRLMENFERPFFGKNISEFWKRWHISMTSWFRDYLFKPLGGYFRSTPRVMFNIFFVWLVTGLWHGAKWTFIISGGLHGILLATRYLWRMKLRKHIRVFEYVNLDSLPRLRDFLYIIVNFHLICITFIFFRANTTEDAFMIARKMFFIQSFGISIKELSHFAYGVFALGLLLFVEIQQEYFNKQTPYWESRVPFFRYLSYAFFVIIILLIGVFDESQFIYFQF